MTWTGVPDVRDRWSSDELPLPDYKVSVLIGDAEALVRTEFPTFTPDTEDKMANVVRIVAGVVIRVLRNPEGIRQVTDAAGPFSTGRTYGGDHPGGLYLSDEDKATLGGARTGQRAFTVDSMPAGGGEQEPDPWYPVLSWS